MSQEFDKEHIKKCLQEANIYEENMTDDLMIEFYKAIKNSETSLHEENDRNNSIVVDEAEKSLNESANELLEAINNSESVAPSQKKANETFTASKSIDDEDSLDAFSQDILHKAKTKLKEKEEEANNNNNNNINIEDDKSEKNSESDTILDIKKTPIGFNDMPKSQYIEKNMLKIISHELKFINIQNSKRFLTSDSETRIKMLCNYFKAAAKLKAHYASLSDLMVPLGKPITAIDHDLCVNPVISSLKEEELPLSSETTYVSRSGRLTKRKVYNEEDELSQESFSSAKKLKNDNDWISKTTPGKEKPAKVNLKLKDVADKNVKNHSVMDRPAVSNKPCTITRSDKPYTITRSDKPCTITSSDVPYTITRSESPDSSQSDVVLTETKDKFEFDALKESTPIPLKPRTYQKKQPSNDEIMAKSSLFRDIGTPKRGRTEAMMNAAIEEMGKKKQQEEQMEKFTNSLDLDSQQMDDEVEKIVVDDDADVFVKKRVVPPLPGRKPIHGRKRGGGAGPEPLNITTKKANTTITEETSSSSSTVVNGVSKRAPRRSTSNSADTKGDPSSSSASRGKKEVNMTPCPLCSVSFPQKEIEEHAATCGEDMFAQTPQPKLSRITCEICDQVVPLTTDYEVHVTACIAKKNGY